MVTYRNEDDLAAQVYRLIRGLIHIQLRHNYWFESRHGLSSNQEYDVIANHVIITCNYPKLIFGYWADSELPDNIRDECNACFDELFSSAMN